jgi:hypothetical protein
MYRRILIGLFVVLSLTIFTSAVFASTYGGTVVFTCINADAAGTGPHTLNRDNTGAGQEALRVDITDGAGTLIYTLSFSNVLGTFAGGIGDFFYTTAPQYNPITFRLTSLAGNGFAEQVDVLVQGSCAGLPTALGAGDFCGLGIPDGSVIGDMPFNTQAYWAPGEAASGVIINAGTYHVIGQDATGEWRKIVLGCAHLWVPIGSMGPSYQSPQNGAPLPTRVVS